MNLYLRLLWVIWGVLRRPKLVSPLEVSDVHLCVLPNDLDCNMHMNNGRYLTIMDLGRLDLIFRSGLYRAAKAGHWIPILSVGGIRFRMELKLWQCFTLQSRILGWDDQWFVIEQRFIMKGGPRDGAVAAVALVRGAFYNRDKGAIVDVADVKRAIDYHADSPPLPDYAAQWLQASEGLRSATADDKEAA